jgi:hypothetical protein
VADTHTYIYRAVAADTHIYIYRAVAADTQIYRALAAEPYIEALETVSYI